MKHRKNPHRDTKKYERYELIGWKKDIKQTQQCCYVSKRTDQLEVHHADVSFSEIFNEAHKVLGLTYHNDTKDYAPEDLKALTDKVLELHNKAIGIVLTHDIHKQLHQRYGTHVDMNQIEEFKTNYRKGDR